MHFIFALCRPVLCLFQESSCPSAQSWKSKLILRSLVEWYKCFRNFASFTLSLDWCILISALLNFYPFMALVCRDCIILIFIKANLLSYYIASFLHMCCVSKKSQASLPFSKTGWIIGKWVLALQCFGMSYMGKWDTWERKPTIEAQSCDRFTCSPEQFSHGPQQPPAWPDRNPGASLWMTSCTDSFSLTHTCTHSYHATDLYFPATKYSFIQSCWFPLFFLVGTLFYCKMI